MIWIYLICMVLCSAMICEIYIMNELISRMKNLIAQHNMTRKGLNNLIDAFNRYVSNDGPEDRMPEE